VIQGGVDVFTGETFPATKFVLVLVARLAFDPQEAGKQFRFVGELVDHEGNAIFPALGGTFEAPPHPRHPDRPGWMTLFLNCAGVAFPAPGDYFFRLTIDRQRVAEVMIEAVLQEKTT
jgi:hypothetical protein